MENLYFTVMIVVCCLCFMLILNCRNQVADRLTLLRLFLLIFHEAFLKLACVYGTMYICMCVHKKLNVYALELFQRDELLMEKCVACDLTVLDYIFWCWISRS